MKKKVWLKKVDTYLWSVYYGTEESWERSSPMCKKDAMDLLNLYQDRILPKSNEAKREQVRRIIKDKGRQALTKRQRDYAVSENIIVYSNDL